MIADVLLDAVCAVVSVYAARSMLNDVYRWGEFGFGSVLLMCAVALVLSLGMELAFFAGEKRKAQIQWGTLGGGTLIFIGFLWFGDNWRVMSSGVLKMLSVFTEYYDSYYGTEIALKGGHVMDVPGALTFSLMLLLFLTLWAAKKLRFNLILAIPSILVFATELMVGYSPKATGIFLMFIGIVLANASGFKLPDLHPAVGKRTAKVSGFWRFSWVVVAVCVAFGCVQLQKYKTDSAKDFVESVESIRDVLNELLSVFRADTSDDSDTQGGGLTHELNNDSPYYRDRTRIQLWMSEAPQGPLYLKGYSADDYEDGVWNTTAREFKNACAEASYDSLHVGSGVVNLGVTKLAQNYGVSSLSQGMFGKEFRIFFYFDSGEEIYLPYFAEIESEQLGMVADSHYYKKESFRNLSMTIWYYENQYRSRLDHFTSNRTEEWELWYESYIEQNYLDVPEELSSVKEIADQLGGGVIIGSFTENDLRLAKAQMVANWMEKNTEYSLELPELPAGADPIEYFLGISRTGYCMHYASAAVMILRELGVPARFATGYVASEASFEPSGDGFQALVIDRQSHAWAEIYLSGIGWVPFEVTKGYQNSIPNFTGNNQESRPSEGESGGAGQNTEEDTDEMTTEGDTEEDGPSKSPSKGQNTNEKTTDANVDVNKSNRQIDLKKIVRIALIVIGVLLVVTVIAYAIIRLMKEYRERLLREIRRRQNRIAIRMINRRIYRKLRLLGKVWVLNLRDNRYEEILKETYPDIAEEEWKKFMDLVKAAAFSKREFTDDEVKFCYRIYQMTKPHR